jgi:hypothetical protein
MKETLYLRSICLETTDDSLGAFRGPVEKKTISERMHQ